MFDDIAESYTQHAEGAATASGQTGINSMKLLFGQKNYRTTFYFQTTNKI
jgi:hypothetical protein